MVSKRKVRLPRSVRRIFPNVESAVDATKSVEVSVSRRDCKESRRLNPSECALARAAKRELHADGVIIGLSTSYIIKGKQAIRFDTPDSVRRELISFDRHKDFEPGDYYLIPKSPTCRLGVINSRERGGKHKEVRKFHHSARVRILPSGAE